MLRHHWYSGLPQHAPDIPVLTPPIRDPFETRHVLTEVSEKYWSKLVTSQVYLEKPSDIVAVLEAPFGAGVRGSQARVWQRPQSTGSMRRSLRHR